MISSRALQELEISSGNLLNVPLRNGGEGILRIGKNNTFGFFLGPRLGSGEILLQPRGKGSVLSIGRGNIFSNNVTIIAKQEVLIGDNCLIGDQVMILDSDFHEIDPTRRRHGSGISKRVSIGNNVWLGSRSMVLKGVSIGENTVVGAMSLVSTNLPANCVAAGVPAKIIRHLEQER